MRRLVLGLTFLALLVPTLHARPGAQRLGIPAGTISVPAGGSRVAQAFCMDQHLSPPVAGRTAHPATIPPNAGGRWADATVRFGDGTTASLPDALRNGQLVAETHGRYPDLGVRFTDRSNRGGATVTFGTPGVFGDTPGRTVTWIDPAGIRPGETAQKDAWRANHAAGVEPAVLAAGRAGSVEAFARTTPEWGPVLTVVRERDGGVLVLTRDAEYRHELWRVAGGRRERVATGDEAGRILSARQLEAVRAYDQTPAGRRTAFAYAPPAAVGEAVRVHIGGQVIDLTWLQVARLVVPRVGAWETVLPPEVAERFRAAAGGRDVVFVRDPFARAAVLQGSGAPVHRFDGSDRRHIDPARLLVGLQAELPTVRFFLDDPDDLPAVAARAAQIPLVAGAKDVAVVHDPDQTFQDRDVFTAIAPDLARLNLPTYPISFGPNAAPVPNITATNLIVLSGHKDEHFREYVDRLGRAGVFRGRVVALFSCAGMADEAVNSQLVNEYGARGVLYFKTPLEAAASTMVLKELSERLARPDPQPRQTLRAHLDAAVDAALRRAPNKATQRDLHDLRRGVTQVSDGRRHPPQGGPGGPTGVAILALTRRGTT